MTASTSTIGHCLGYALLGIILLLPATAVPEIYKWVDEHGRTHYGEKPPAKSPSKQVPIKNTSAPPAGNTSPESQKDRQQRLLRAFEEERLQRESNRQKAKQEREQSKKKCAYARNRLRIAQGGYRLYDFDKQGNRVYLDSQQIDQARARARQEVKRLCN